MCVFYNAVENCQLIINIFVGACKDIVKRKGEKGMFFKKNERKTHNVRAILTVGALATIGAISIVKSGKKTASDLWCKFRGVFKSKDVVCSENSEEE